MKNLNKFFLICTYSLSIYIYQLIKWVIMRLIFYFSFLLTFVKLTYTMDKEEQNRVSLISADENLKEEDQNSVESRSLLNRYFGRMSEGSLRGSIFALLASAMGTGVFNLPLRTQQIGMIPFGLFIFLGGLFSWIGMLLLIRLIMQKKFKSYSEMAEAAYGNILKRISQFCIIVYPWGITICFQVIFAKFICQLLYDQLGVDLYNDRKKEQYNQKGNWVRIGCNLGCLMFGLIFALKKNISMLQKIAIVGVVSVIFNISTVVIISLVGFTRPDDKLKYRGIFHVNWDNVNWFKTGGWEAFSLLAQGMASILFCYVNHQMLFPLSMSLKRATKKRFYKIINRVHVVQFLAYSIIGITAYLLLLEHLVDHEIAPVVISSIPTKIVMVGKILMLAALFFAVPLNMFPARQSFFEALNLQTTNKNHIIVTVSMMVSSTTIAILFIQVNSYFGLLGGTAGVLMAGGIPALCYFKLTQKLSSSDILLLVICALITILASFGAILSVI